ncbi:MAG: DUF1684 domain-containing protein [Acidobacteriota bacterium]
MTSARRRIRIAALALLTVLSASAQTPNYAAERAERAQGLTQPYGWFSLISLESLLPGSTTVGSAKGNKVVLAAAPAHMVTLSSSHGIVTVTAADPCLKLQGKPVPTGFTVSTDEGSSSALSCNTLRFWAIDRGGKRYLRTKDSNAPALKHFHGLSWYAPDAHLRLTAQWRVYPTPHTMSVLNKLGQITPVQVPGYVEFTLNGKTYKLTPMEADKDSLFFVFRDETFKTTTDGGGRFLVTSAPSNGIDHPGTVTLDFNEATNPPCAYSPFATCPLASKENRLPVSIAAGEKRYEQ